MFIHPYYAEAEIGPLLAGQAPEAYWLEVLLRTWPVARYNPPGYIFPQVRVTDSYMAARHSREVIPYLWIVEDQELVIDADYARAGRAATLQMVAHTRLPDRVQAGTKLPIDSLWVSRGPVQADYTAQLSLVDQEGREVAQIEGQLISGWAGTPTSAWHPYEFHDVGLELYTPCDAPPGVYHLRLTLYLSGGSGSVAQACVPVCAFNISDVFVSH